MNVNIRDNMGVVQYQDNRGSREGSESREEREEGSDGSGCGGSEGSVNGSGGGGGEGSGVSGSMKTCYRKSRRSKKREILGELRVKLAMVLEAKLMMKRKFDWISNARKNQLMPSGEWKIWLILAGRGFGKTRTGAETIRQLVDQYGYRRVCLIGATDLDVVNVMIRGKSGLVNVYPDAKTVKVQESKNLVVWKNGAQGMMISGCAYERLRGPEFDCAWVDELAKFTDPQAVFDQLMMALRLNSEHGLMPKLIITTTPKSIKFLKQLIKRPDVYVTYGSTFDNRENLSESYLETVQNTYGGTRFGAQELDGQIIDDVELAFCTQIKYLEELDVCNVWYVSIVVAVDPAATNTRDETGIVVCGELTDGRFVVLEDASGLMSPTEWSKKAVELYKKFQAHAIVAEVNQGGDMVETLIRQVDYGVVYHKVYASKSKMVRAQPVAILYDQGKIVHAGRFSKLEEQLLSCEHTHSPDRMDAMVWGMIYLLRNCAREEIGVFRV